jgi:hypothetical protein
MLAGEAPFIPCCSPGVVPQHAARMYKKNPSFDLRFDLPVLDSQDVRGLLQPLCSTDLKFQNFRHILVWLVMIVITY